MQSPLKEGVWGCIMSYGSFSHSGAKPVMAK